MDRGAWWATVHGVAMSQTHLKWLSTHLETGDLKKQYQTSFQFTFKPHVDYSNSLRLWSRGKPTSFIHCMCACLVARLYPTFVTPWIVAHQSPLSMGFSRQEYWSGLPFPPPGDFSNPEIKLYVSCVSCIAGRFFAHWAIREAAFTHKRHQNGLEDPPPSGGMIPSMSHLPSYVGVMPMTNTFWALTRSQELSICHFLVLLWFEWCTHYV